MAIYPALCLAVILATVAGVAIVFRGGAYVLAALFLLVNACLFFIITYFGDVVSPPMLWSVMIFFILATVQVLFGQVIIYYRHHGGSGTSERSKVGPGQDDVS